MNYLREREEFLLRLSDKKIIVDDKLMNYSSISREIKSIEKNVNAFVKSIGRCSCRVNRNRKTKRKKRRTFSPISHVLLLSLPNDQRVRKKNDSNRSLINSKKQKEEKKDEKKNFFLILLFRSRSIDRSFDQMFRQKKRKKNQEYLVVLRKPQII